MLIDVIREVFESNRVKRVSGLRVLSLRYLEELV